jgi:hypothetical protein
MTRYLALYALAALLVCVAWIAWGYRFRRCAT